VGQEVLVLLRALPEPTTLVGQAAAPQLGQVEEIKTRLLEDFLLMPTQVVVVVAGVTLEPLVDTPWAEAEREVTSKQQSSF